jgi:drug/metabolite transporter (DMT)-like permease
VRPQVLGWTGVVFLIISGSTFPVFGKQLTQTFSPISLLFISELLGGLFVALWFGLSPILRNLKALRRKDRLPLFLSCFINSTIAPFLWFTGLHTTSAINAELFSRAEMLFLIGLSVLVIHEKITRGRILSLCVILFGILCVALEGFTVGIDTQIGDFLILASALAYSVGGILVKKFLHSLHPELIIAVRAVIASMTFFLLSPFITANLGAELLEVNVAIVGVLLGYGFITKFLGIYGFYQAIEYLRVSTVSMMGTLSIVGGMIFATLYLGEHVHWYQVLGAFFIVFGVLLTQRIGVHSSKKHQEHHIRQHHRHAL